MLGERFGTELLSGIVPGIRKQFGYVSADQQIVGDATYYTLVGGERLPPATFAIITEQVWLLEKTNADEQFLVFGNDREVPLRWLERYGPLAGSAQFFFLSDEATWRCCNERDGYMANCVQP